MAISTEVKLIKITDLKLDPKNPRLGRAFVSTNPKQPAIQLKLEDASLDELIVSFLESTFWPQEALITTVDLIGKKSVRHVIEGNRRLAALKILQQYREGKELSSKWESLIDNVEKKQLDWLDQIPCITVESRADVKSYLGFRHVSGIKEWRPADKAEFIAGMIENDGLSYQTVMRRIGSKTHVVRSHYVAYKLLQQMEKQDDKIDISRVENKFSVLSLALRSSGTRAFLHIDIDSNVEKLQKKVVPEKHIENLIDFAK
ncbi:MAG: hypothetical protein JKY95_00065 [Planctomycetaceae bacterium]|nr:hypothetical protein [Planctomycetaceae bacterium]